MRPLRLAVILLLAGVAFAVLEYLVLRSRYNQVKTDRDHLSTLLREKDQELVEAKASYRERVEDLAKQIEMHKAQLTGCQAETEKLREAARLLPSGQEKKLRKENERLLADLAEKDRLLGDEAARLQALRDQLNAANQLIDLFKLKQAEKTAGGATEQLGRLQASIDKFAQDHNGDGIEAGPGKLILRDSLLFALGTADVGEPGQNLLADIAREFKDRDVILQVDGHTDDHRVSKPETIRRFADNWGLCAARAAAVIRLLAKNGVREANLQGGFCGMWRPRAVPVTDDADRARNRRVEIRFLPGQPAAPADPEPRKATTY